MERLTIKELAPYLSYELKMISSDGQIGELIGFIENDSIIKRIVWDSGCREMGIEAGNDIKISRCCLHAENMGTPNKPLLRSLSSIGLKWFQDNIDEAIEDFRINCEPENNHFSVEVCEKVLGWSALSLEEYQLFYEHHVDIKGLIGRGLALPIDGKGVEGNG